MTAAIVAILSKYGESTTETLRAKTPKATGKTAQSLRYEVTEEGSTATLRILGTQYYMVIQTGRKATPQYTKPSKTFVDKIREWLSAVGGNVSTAYAIAKTIHAKGTKLWQQGGNDLVSSVVNQSLVDQISKESLSAFANEYLVSTVNMFDDNRN
jgi:hypothetical protein